MKAAPKLSLLIARLFSFLLAACSGVKQTSAAAEVAAPRPLPFRPLFRPLGTGLVLQDNGADRPDGFGERNSYLRDGGCNNGAYAVTVRLNFDALATCVIVGGSARLRK